MGDDDIAAYLFTEADLTLGYLTAVIGYIDKIFAQLFGHCFIWDQHGMCRVISPDANRSIHPGNQKFIMVRKNKSGL